MLAWARQKRAVAQESRELSRQRIKTAVGRRLVTRRVASALGSPAGIAWTFALGTWVGSNRASSRAERPSADREQESQSSLVSRLLAVALWLNNAYRLAQTPQARAAAAALFERRADEPADGTGAIGARIGTTQG